MSSRFTPITNIRLIADDLMLLVEQEMRLARQELDQKLSQAFSGVVMAVAGLLAAFVAAGVLIQAIIAGLAVELPYWAAASIVGAVFLVVAIVLLSVAYARLNPSNLTPTRTLHSLSQTANTVKENIK